MAKRKTHKEDRRGWPLFNRLLADYIELTRFPELPDRPKQGKNYEYWPDGALCANGNPYHGCIRLGSTNKLMIGFSGGGVSVDGYTAARPQRVGGQGEMFYSDDVRFGDVILRMGTFGHSKKNPFRDWSLLFVTYATGDFHCGTGDYPYTDLNGKPAVLHHHGYTNFQMLLTKIKELVPNPEQILVTGFSAGAFATSLLTDAVAAAFPKCRDITACVDSAMMHYDWQRVAREVWKAPEEIVAPHRKRDRFQQPARAASESSKDQDHVLLLRAGCGADADGDVSRRRALDPGQGRRRELPTEAQRDAGSSAEGDPERKHIHF